MSPVKAVQRAIDPLADHIRRVVDSAAPPSPEQIERLRALLPVDRSGRTEVAAA